MEGGGGGGGPGGGEGEGGCVIFLYLEFHG